MKVGSENGFSADFLKNSQNASNSSRARGQQVSAERRSENLERQQSRREARSEGLSPSEVRNFRARGQRRRIQDEILNPTPPSNDTPPATQIEPGVDEVDQVEQSPAIEDRQTSDLRSLAEQYVQQFENQAGRTLSSSERESRVNDVFEFYSAPGREGRLESIVFSELAQA